MMRLCTASASVVGTCDHCNDHPETAVGGPEQVITVMSLHRNGAVVFAARFCEKHFLQFSDVISDQVAYLLYPKARTN